PPPGQPDPSGGFSQQGPPPGFGQQPPQGDPSGFGGPPPGDPSGFGGPPPGQQPGGFGQQPPPPGAPGGFPPQGPPPGQPGGFGGPPPPGYGGAPQGGNTQLFGWIVGGLVGLFGLIALIFSFVDLGDVLGLEDDVPSSIDVDEALDRLGMASSGALTFYIVMLLIGSVATLGSGVMLALASKFSAVLQKMVPIATAVGG